MTGFLNLFDVAERKIAFASTYLPVLQTENKPPGELIAAVGGQKKLGQIKVIKDLRINNPFILDLLTLLGSHRVSRKMEGRLRQK